MNPALQLQPPQITTSLSFKGGGIKEERRTLLLIIPSLRDFLRAEKKIPLYLPLRNGDFR
jgi:hypothetical protein